MSLADFDQRQADILAQVKTLADDVNGNGNHASRIGLMRSQLWWICPLR